MSEGTLTHRPYPPPRRPWAMAMVWHELLFMHWPVQAARLREFVPPGLEIEAHGGSAWLGVVPFRMTGVRHRLLPALPGASAFPELNVRTYVRGPDGRAGVWFFSLDAPHRMAVRVARAVFGLAYMDAAMSCRRDREWVAYQSVRTGPCTALAFGSARTPAAEFRARYRPRGPVFHPVAGTLDHFLTSRFCLYAWARGALRRAEIDHAPWPLQTAEARVERNSTADALGLDGLTDAHPQLHYADALDVVAWLPRRVG